MSCELKNFALNKLMWMMMVAMSLLLVTACEKDEPALTVEISNISINTSLSNRSAEISLSVFLYDENGKSVMRDGLKVAYWLDNEETPRFATGSGTNYTIYLTGLNPGQMYDITITASSGQSYDTVHFPFDFETYDVDGGSSVNPSDEPSTPENPSDEDTNNFINLDYYINLLGHSKNYIKGKVGPGYVDVSQGFYYENITSNIPYLSFHYWLEDDDMSGGYAKFDDCVAINLEVSGYPFISAYYYCIGKYGLGSYDTDGSYLIETDDMWLWIEQSGNVLDITAMDVNVYSTIYGSRAGAPDKKHAREIIRKQPN